jgi:PST family polysaccharide transporter
MSRAAEETRAAAGSSYGQILKSSALIGGSSVAEIGLRIVRAKVMALLLGPAGVGWLGLYTSIADLAQSITGMGVSSSGVREIAGAAGSQDPARIARTVRVLHLATIGFGIVGAGVLALFAQPISEATFGDDQHTSAVALLAFAVLLRQLAAAHAAVTQGLRRIGDLARIAVWSALLGTLATIAIVYVHREEGLVPALVAAAGVNFAAAWWYGRRVELPRPAITAAQLRQTLSVLVRLGFAFMVSGLLVMGSAYAIRVIVLRTAGVDAAGLYQAAWGIGGLYLGFILQAMGTDFYPRLTAVADDARASNRLVNEQTLIGVLLAGPGVLATLAFAPLVVTLFYSAAFQAAVDALRWICLGMMLRVITWPLGFIVVAKGLQRLFVAIDLGYALAHVGLALLLVEAYGVSGAGMAFLGSYLLHGLAVYPIARWLTGFRYSRQNRRLIGGFVVTISAVFAGFHVLPPSWASGFAALATVASGVHALRVLVTLAPLERLPSPLQRLLRCVPAALTGRRG